MVEYYIYFFLVLCFLDCCNYTATQHELREAYCVIHGRTCSLLRNGAGLLHIAGTPCIDYSGMGDMEGADGPTIVFFLTWAGIRRIIQEPVLLHECVPEFAEWLLLDELPMYYVDKVVLSPSDLGWPITRNRSWCV